MISSFQVALKNAIDVVSEVIPLEVMTNFSYKSELKLFRDVTYLYISCFQFYYYLH